MLIQQSSSKIVVTYISKPSHDLNEYTYPYIELENISLGDILFSQVSEVLL